MTSKCTMDPAVRDDGVTYPGGVLLGDRERGPVHGLITTPGPADRGAADREDRSPGGPAGEASIAAPAGSTIRMPRSTDGWTSACALHRLLPGRGVAVLLRGGAQAALFLLDDGALHAVGNVDPVGRAAVMSRGIVGDHAGEPTVASPLLKEVYSLIDGRCLDDPGLRLPVHKVRTVGGVVQVGPAEPARVCTPAS